MRIRAKESVLLIIDIQERLLPAILDGQAMVEHSAWLQQIAARVGVPVLLTEQYSKGLGPTVATLRDGVPAEAIVEKLHFSATGDGELFKRPGGERRQFIVCGCETHVCVMQSVLDLLERGHRVFVVEEAVSSRRASDKTLALARMRQAGAEIVSREMVAFEWLEQAGTELFKSISREFIR
ncbi:hydrolase [Pseudomonas sp. S5(2021)]|jgi:nicotinamidase-related amidase|uniref:Isochorismatase n=1 Tax=Stutzerimonas balearica DSM 6083 TaxID=1123016 RepID=A0A8D3XZT0_9GAMM|nr:hydrolase [Stutzerimonas balearica]MBB61343.1 hydrolase [Pseudomonas sp.]MBZ5755542.1 hydrolase [Pseudomonas sp. S5(2021)]AJE14643.1 isochorismatase [Stutzerimonas balearica DSM 6083]SDM39015.1 Nicotinamidase-related amidase [Stutzerimonas balearica DSM 6083]HAF92033.1 hydrolase [Pseudomonas sp.]